MRVLCVLRVMHKGHARGSEIAVEARSARLLATTHNDAPSFVWDDLSL